MISTADLSLLPNHHTLKLLCQSLAMLDAILGPEWDHRYYSFDAYWSSNKSLASMRDGSGDHIMCLFSLMGAVLKGFAHESPMSPYRCDPPCQWPGVLDSLPVEFKEILTEPAFVIGETTFCIWQTLEGGKWQHGDIQFPATKDPDGSADMLSLLDGQPLSYQQWAEEYYEQPVSLSAIEHIYQHRPLTERFIEELNPELSLHDLADDIAEIGY